MDTDTRIRELETRIAKLEAMLAIAVQAAQNNPVLRRYLKTWTG